MNIHGYSISRVNGPGNRFTLWTQGCSKGCVNCFNPETWNNRDNIILSPLEIFEHIKDFELDGVTITGGDPFEQEDELLELLILIDGLNLSKGVIVFSGFTYDEIRDNITKLKIELDRINTEISSKDDLDKKISISGWINKKRDHGNLLFVDLRDNYGITQCIIDKENKNFLDLENIIRLSKFLICCEGSISHLSYSFKIKTFALIEKKREVFYRHWTSHMGNNIKLIYRSNINEVMQQIKNNIKFF